MGHWLRTLKAAAITAVIIGGAAMLAGSIDYELGRVYRGGLAAALIGGGYLLAVRSALVGAMVERARSDSYDEGFADGCRASLTAGLADRPLTLLRTPQQLGQQGDVGGGADRVG